MAEDSRWQARRPCLTSCVDPREVSCPLLGSEELCDFVWTFVGWPRGSEELGGVLWTFVRWPLSCVRGELVALKKIPVLKFRPKHSQRRTS